VDSYVTLEVLLRRLIRDAQHTDVRVLGVSDAPLSEAAGSSCFRDGPMTTIEGARCRVRIQSYFSPRGRRERRAYSTARKLTEGAVTEAAPRLLTQTGNGCGI
jgi:hypothetical protein